MNSKVQLQQIENIGLIVYYRFGLDTQRKMLIDELNSYGFNIKYESVSLDKLRTFYYVKELYSKNKIKYNFESMCKLMFNIVFFFIIIYNVNIVEV